MQARTAITLLAILGGTLATVQATDIGGTVTSQTGKPIDKAIVTLVGKNLKDTTDAQGAFKIYDGTFTINPLLNSPRTETIGLEKGVLLFSIARTASVRIDLFDMHGRLVKRLFNRPASAGSYRVDIAGDLSAEKMMIVKTTVGSYSVTFRYAPFDNGSRILSESSPASRAGQKFAAIKAAVDSLRITAAGYTTKTVPVSSYQETVSAKLDSMTLAKFSFFVTSLAGLQALAGNEKGFGGDFRFGKTGQGAGLLGADSICQCLAERSMPGSKVKQWRAFLSVVKGPNGTQVNAIDRIGNGPWYDRVGRLLGNNLTELTSGDRPASADAAIKNDLPNEDGVPNHRPDPNKEQVDNHMTITGSDTKGQLYSGSLGSTTGGGGSTGGATGNATCDDWTSTTSAFKARCGLSWPQAMTNGMKNWISQMNTAGCEIGYDLSSSTGPGKTGVYTIGNGGGYGGFYCFALTP